MNILITGAWKPSSQALSHIIQLGNEVYFQPNEADPLVTDYENVEAVICNGLFLHHPLDKFTHLRYIQLTSAGFDRVPLERIRQRGIVLHNARGVYSTPMAEFALAGVLQIYKQMDFFRRNQTQHRWEKHRGLLELEKKTVCILGCGSVGQACARVFSALGCEILGVDITPFTCQLFSKIFHLNELDRIIPNADIVILCLPLVSDTFHLFEETRFARMKDQSILVNISRGKVVHTPALIQALNEKLVGAVLDVFEEEPIDPQHPLWDAENVVLTPHNSFVGERNSERLESLIIENLKKFDR